MQIQMSREGLEICISREETKLTVALKGGLDSRTSPELEYELSPLFRGVTEFVADFSDVDYISSAGIRVLLKAMQAMELRGKMTIKNPNSEVREVLEITGFSDILSVE